MSKSKTVRDVTDPEHLNVVENLIVEGEVIAWDDINASFALNLPVIQTKSLALAEQLVTRDLSGPVRFGGFLEVTVDSHPRETENGSLCNGQRVEVEGERGRGKNARSNHAGRCGDGPESPNGIVFAQEKPRDKSGEMENGCAEQ